MICMFHCLVFIIQKYMPHGCIILNYIWPLQAETTVINQCTQLLSTSADPTYVMTYINHSFPQHRRYLCAGAWILMYGHPESINSLHLVSFSRYKNVIRIAPLLEIYLSL